MTDEELFAGVPHPAESVLEPRSLDEFEMLREPSMEQRPKGPSPFAQGLNPDQLDAVVHQSGPLLVVAGAGSGKTRVLTHRIAHLIHDGVHPSKILAITFTNKGRSEMRERVAELVGPVVKTMWVSTFHSACVRILRAECRGARLPAPVFDLRLSRHQPPRTGTSSATRGSTRSASPHGECRASSRSTGRMSSSLRPKRWPTKPRTSSTASTQRSTPSTRRVCCEAGAMDFDDLLTNVVDAVLRARRHPGALPRAVQPHPRRRVSGYESGAERDCDDACRRPPCRYRCR